MRAEAIELDPLRRAAASLQIALELMGSDLEGAVGQVVRDGAIKRFEFTFELARKTLRRFLVADGDTDVIPTTGARAILLVSEGARRP